MEEASLSPNGPFDAQHKNSSNGTSNGLSVLLMAVSVAYRQELHEQRRDETSDIKKTADCETRNDASSTFGCLSSSSSLVVLSRGENEALYSINKYDYAMGRIQELHANHSIWRKSFDMSPEIVPKRSANSNNDDDDEDDEEIKKLLLPPPDCRKTTPFEQGPSPITLPIATGTSDKTSIILSGSKRVHHGKIVSNASSSLHFGSAFTPSCSVSSTSRYDDSRQWQYHQNNHHRPNEEFMSIKNKNNTIELSNASSNCSNNIAKQQKVEIFESSSSQHFSRHYDHHYNYTFDLSSSSSSSNHPMGNYHWHNNSYSNNSDLSVPTAINNSNLKSNSCMPQTQKQTWICDVCQSAYFSTYDEACEHEKICCGSASSSTRNPTYHESVSCQRRRTRYSSSNNDSTRNNATTASSYDVYCDEDEFVSISNYIKPSYDSHNVSGYWFSGCISLATSHDYEWLSDLNCFIRKHCVEAFTAKEADVADCKRRRTIITLGQVGIRCSCCASKHSFPMAISGIYESVQQWQRTHLPVCSIVTQDTRHKIMELQCQQEQQSSQEVVLSRSRQYWIDSARVLGMVDTIHGIRFAEDPKLVLARGKEENEQKRYMDGSNNYCCDINTANNNNKEEFSFSFTASSTNNKNGVSQHEKKTYSLASSLRYSTIDADNDGLAAVEKEEMTPQYVVELMRQVEACRYTETDRFLARSKCAIGFPGFQCRHCSGNAGLGKYFPSSVKSLSSNSTSQNIHSHLMKCRRVPQETKGSLLALKHEHSTRKSSSQEEVQRKEQQEQRQPPRLVNGWRKSFFARMWNQLHGSSDNSN